MYGIIFFGVLYNGIDITLFIPMAGNGLNRSLIEAIGQDNSQILSAQQREFSKALGGEGDSEVFCFYEMLKSPTAI